MGQNVITGVINSLLPVTTNYFQLLRQKNPVGGAEPPEPVFLKSITTNYYQLLHIITYYYHYYHYYSLLTLPIITHYCVITTYYNLLFRSIMSSNGNE